MGVNDESPQPEKRADTPPELAADRGPEADALSTPNRDEDEKSDADGPSALPFFKRRRGSLDDLTPLEVLQPLIEAFCETLSDEERTKLADLRLRLTGSEADLHHKECEHGSDISLYRHLVAREWSLDGAHDQLAKTLQWRIDTNASDTIADRDPLHEFYDVCTPHYYGGYDKMNRPIYWEKSGLVNVSEVLKVATFEEMRRRHIWGMEQLARLAVKRSKTSNNLIYQHVVVMDMKDLAFSVDRRALQLFREVNQIDQKYYPERLGMLFMVNTPWTFRTLWTVIKSFLSERTISKFHILGADYQEELAKYISSDQIPKEYGGTASFDVPSLMSLSDAVKANIIPGSVLWADVSEQKKLMPNAEALKSAP